MRRHIDVAQFPDEVGGIEALVAAEGDRFGSIGAGLDHLERRQPFGMTGDAGQSGVDEEPVAGLPQGMADEAKAGFHAPPFSVEHGIGGARRHLRLVAPPPRKSTSALRPPVGGSLPSPPSLGLRLFRLAQASMSVPSTEKCCLLRFSPRKSTSAL